jgi:hypothetical protein
MSEVQEIPERSQEIPERSQEILEESQEILEGAKVKGGKRVMSDSQKESLT